MERSFNNMVRRIRLSSSKLAMATFVAAVPTMAHAVDYSEGPVVTGQYTDTTSMPGFTGTSGTCAYVGGVGTCTSTVEAHDLSSSAHVGQTISPTPANPSPSDNGPTNIGTLAVGSNYISGASLPYGAVANQQTQELQYQDSDYVTFTVPDGATLTRLDLLDGSSIEAGDSAFIGLANGANVYVNLPSSKGLLGYTLLKTNQIGSDILPAIGGANPPGFDSTMPGSPFAGATTFKGALSSGTYTLWLLDGDNDFTYKLNLQVSNAPEPASWMMMIGGFGAVGGTLRRRGLSLPRTV